MDFKTFFNNLSTDIKVELYREFTENFRRKSFFGEKWDAAKHPPKRGSLLVRHAGGLKDSLKASVKQDTNGVGIHFTSSKPYAQIQNEGGTITVTRQMQRYFWAMYYKATGGMTKTKSGRASNNQRNRDLNADAVFWKAMALKKVGSKITIPKRQFIGKHPKVDSTIKEVIDENMKELDKQLAKELKK